MRGEAGQATVEWVGLVLLATLVLGALAAFRGPAGDPGLGETLARRITCGGGAACAEARARPTSATAPQHPSAAESPLARATPPPAPRGAVAPPAPRRSLPALGRAAPPPRSRRAAPSPSSRRDVSPPSSRRDGPPPAPGRAAAPPASRSGGKPPTSRPARRHRSVRSRAIDAFRRLRGVSELTERLWIVCFGVRRYLYELDHPRAPTEPMSVDEALDIADACLNPASFLEDD